MKRDTISKTFASLTAALLAGLLAAGCATTTHESPNIVERVQGGAPAGPPPNGFLGNDYALLHPPAEGSDQKAALLYISPSGNFASYSKIMIAPVTYWADNDSKISAQDQQTLCNYFDNVLKEHFSKNFTLVDQPGPGVAKLSVALIDASSAIPVLRTVSVVIPQARVLNVIQSGLTGSYAFVGSATGAAKLTDSVSGTLLAAWEDQQLGGLAVKNAAVWQWGDAEHAMDYWADGLNKKLQSLGVQHTTSTVSSD